MQQLPVKKNDLLLRLKNSKIFKDVFLFSE